MHQCVTSNAWCEFQADSRRLQLGQMLVFQWLLQQIMACRSTLFSPQLLPGCAPAMFFSAVSRISQAVLRGHATAVCRLATRCLLADKTAHKISNSTQPTYRPCSLNPANAQAGFLFHQSKPLCKHLPHPPPPGGQSGSGCSSQRDQKLNLPMSIPT